MSPITVMIVDDHTVVREGLRAIFEDDEEVELVGEAADGLEALNLVAELHPNVVLMDIRMPLMDGLEATRRIKAEHPTTAVIIVTSYDDDPLVIEAVLAGAAGYLLKDASQDFLRHSLRAVADGGVVIKAPVLRKAIDSIPKLAKQTEAELLEEMPLEKLTERELEVLKLVSTGWTNKEIAASLSLAEVTVKKHVQTIIAKLNASDRTHAAIKAVRMGLIS